jgi:CRISPR-associated Csx2 family protein
MKVITFLGTNDYKETIYTFGSKQAKPTKLFPKALCEILELQELPVQELLVVVTEQAKRKWLNVLSDEVKTLNIKLTAIDIPEGHQQEDLWTIFDRLTNNLAKDDEVVFDITHSFRTLPFLSFLAANYLQTAKSVKIKGIYYGAFEAGQISGDSEVKMAPVFNLTPFLELSRWITATDKFISTGNARELGKILEEIHRRERTQPRQNVQMPTTLQKIGKSIGELSDAMLVNRPREIAEKATTFQHIIKDEKTVMETEQFAKPFAVLLERIGKEFEPFVDFSLVSQRKMIDWYLEHGQIVQSVSLMREWLVSLVCKKCSLDLFDKDDRKHAEEILNYLSSSTVSGNESSSKPLSEEAEFLKDEFNKFAESKNVVKIWNETVDLRNDVLHFGFRKIARPASAVMRQAKQLNEKLKKLNGI